MWRRGISIAIAGLVAATVLAPRPPSYADSERSQPGPRAARASWAPLQVPYITLGQKYAATLHFRDTVVDYPFYRRRYGGLLSMAAARDGVIAMPVDYRFGESQFGQGDLLEIGADGTVQRVEGRALGIPMAEPTSRWAFWISYRSRGKSRLIAYDTTTHVRVTGPLVSRSARIFAVDGDAVYVLGLFGDSPAPAAWTPGRPGLDAVPLPAPSSDDSVQLLLDVQAGHVLSVDLDTGRGTITDLDGNLEHRFRRVFGHLSPDGSVLVDSLRVRLRDVATGAPIRLEGLEGLKPWQARWTPAGDLVVSASSVNPFFNYEDADRVFHFVCEVPAGSCQRLRGRSSVGLEQSIEPNGVGQLFTIFASIGSRQSAPRALAGAVLRRLQR